MFHVRIARPASDLARTESMYRQGLSLQVVGRFADHDGFDGVMLAHEDTGYHFEFTRHRKHTIVPAPTPEDLIVFYIPSRSEFRTLCSSMQAAGFQLVKAFNPYWDRQGRTFMDHDGYRVVLWNGTWE
ncbi:MAG TPA: VOC family protein [Steroidobacteraceae bacterium]|nr:VOC family protein [Steroidobacteraceae bacterium]